MTWPTDAVPGEPVAVRFKKWPGTEHWHHDCVWLGEDAHGHWIGQFAGASSTRPGMSIRAETPNVTLVPAGETDWVATLFPAEHPNRVRVYIDLSWDIRWSTAERAVLTGVDLDLDVVRADGRDAWIDDEDEFAEHADAWDYPADVRAAVRATADRLLVEVADRRPPFDEATAAGWLARLAGLADPRG